MSRRSVLVPALVLAFALAACAPSATPAPPTQPAAGGGGVLLTVTGPGGVSKGFSAADLQALPQAKITVDGKDEEGPSLADVLKAAGITDFAELTLTGDVSMTLTRAQVTGDVILDFTNRGTVKLAATSIPKDTWVKDITRIEVK